MEEFLAVQDGSFNDGVIQVRILDNGIPSQPVKMEPIMNPYKPIITSITIERIDYAIKGIGQVGSTITISYDGNELGTDVVDSYYNFVVTIRDYIILNLLPLQNDLTIKMSDGDLVYDNTFEFPRGLLELKANAIMTRYVGEDKYDFEIFPDHDNSIAVYNGPYAMTVSPSNGRYTGTIEYPNLSDKFQVYVNYDAFQTFVGLIPYPPDIWAIYPRYISMIELQDIGFMNITVAVPDDTAIGAAIIVEDWNEALLNDRIEFYDGANPIFSFNAINFNSNLTYRFSIRLVERYITIVRDYEFVILSENMTNGLYPSWDQEGNITLYTVVDLKADPYYYTVTFDSVTSNPPIEILPFEGFATSVEVQSYVSKSVLSSSDLIGHIRSNISESGTYIISEMTLTITTETVPDPYSATFTMTNLNIQVVVP